MIRFSLLITTAIALGSGNAAAQARTDLVSRTELRVCADPHNLPFSDDKQEGFENKIADIVGQDLHLPVTYVWFPQVIGFVRNTLGARRCDVVMGTVSGAEMMDTTNAYYHSGYMIVTRTEDGITAKTLSDPVFADKRIGLIAATPPTDLLLRHNLMTHATSYALTVDTRFESPSRQMMQDLVDHKIDAGLLWGPFAGYYISHDHLPVRAVLLDAAGSPLRLDYHIAMGVRPGETEWRRRLNDVIRRRQDDITHILVTYGVPLLDEQNRLTAGTETTGAPPAKQ